MGKQFFRLCLDDYASGSCSSFSKYYWGTIEMIESFINELKSDPYTSDRFDHLIATYEKYIAGDKKITHKVAYQEVPFLVPAKILAQSTSILENAEWEHLNTYHWIYDIKCEKAESQHLWISCRDEYFRCIKTRFTDLAYKNTLKDYVPIGNMLWGHPGVLNVNLPNVENNLFVIEKTFKNKSVALADAEEFEKTKDPNFSKILDDVFGDG